MPESLRAKSAENQNQSRDGHDAARFKRINDSKQARFAFGTSTKKFEPKKAENALNTSLIDTAKNFLIKQSSKMLGFTFFQPYTQPNQGTTKRSVTSTQK